MTIFIKQQGINVDTHRHEYHQQDDHQGLCGLP